MAKMAAISSVVKLFNPQVVSQTGQTCTASIIFLHGSGDTGLGIKEWTKSVMGRDIAFPHIRVIYPTAPMRPYTPMMGNPSTVWFDRKQISPFVPEDESVPDMCEKLSALIDQEVKNGIALNRIIVGGFSMGGCAALHIAYRYRPTIAGVFGLSCFLNENSDVYKALDGESQDKRYPPLFQTHGELDELVLPEWGHKTCGELRRRGVAVDFQTFGNLYHEFHRKTLHLLEKWILKHLPE